MLGADPDALAGLGISLRRTADRLDVIAAQLDAQLRRTPWRGHDATRFHASWATEHRRALAVASQGCRAHATELDRHAREQRVASSVDSGAPPRPHAAPAPIQPSVRVPELPARELHAAGGVELGLGFGMLQLDGTVSIAELGDGRVRVEWAEATAVGLAAAAGGSLEVSTDSSDASTPLIGAEVAASAGVGVSVRRSWEVPGDAVDGLLFALAVERASSIATQRADLPALVGHVGDTVAKRVTGSDLGLTERVSSLAVSPPHDHAERFVELDTAAVLLAGAGSSLGAGLAATNHSKWRVGERIAADGTRRAVILEADSELAHRVGGSISRSVGMPESTGASRTTLRLDVPTTSATRGEAHLTIRFEDSGGLVEQRIAVDLRRLEPSHELSAAVHSLRRGDPVAALHLLSKATLPSDAVDVSVTTPQLQRTGGAAGASAAVGVGAAVRVRGDVVEIRR